MPVEQVEIDRHRALLDAMAECGKVARGGGAGFGDRRIDRPLPEARHIEDAQALRRRRLLMRAGHADRQPVLVERPLDRRQRQREVIDRARERPDHLGIVEDDRQPVAARDAPGGRLQPNQPAMAGRPADRPAAIGAERQRPEARRHRRRAAARRGPRRQRRVPWVARGAEGRGIGVATAEGEFGDVGLAQDDRAAGTQSRHRCLIRLGDVVEIEFAAPGAGQRRRR